MAYGIIGFSQPSKLFQPSASIWGDCSSYEILDEGTGFYDYKDFVTRLPQTADGSTVTWAIDSGSFAWNTAYSHVMNFATGATASDDVGLATRPIAPIAAGSGIKVWFEASIAVGQITNAQSFFVGLVNLNGLGTKKTLVASSATIGSNTLGTSSGHQSGYGFWMHGDASTNCDAVWFNNITTALTPNTSATTTTAINNQQPTGVNTDASGAGVVLASALSANANNPNTGNPLFVPLTPPGVLVASLATAATTTAPINPTPAQVNLEAADPNQNPQVYLPNSVTGATGFVKLGLRYDGQQYLYYYVNGAQVGKLAISSAMDELSEFAGIVQVMAGTSNATTFSVAFMRTAALLVP